MKKTLVLLGSGEFTPAMKEIDQMIAKDIAPPNVAILPTAAGKEGDWWKWVDQGVAHFAAINISAFGVAIRTKEDAHKKEIISSLQQATIIYISGGDPGYLLSVLTDSPAWDAIHKKYLSGTPLVGSSAGAMILGSHLVSNIYQVFDGGEKTVRWVPAFGLVPHTIWPHFDYIMREDQKKFDELMAHAPATVTSDWLGIDENTAVIWNNREKPVTLGKGRAHWKTL